ncbi:hypothetical protein A4X13_0g2517 [Tilletia indica]|uniref:Core Histone H2A/H2B/H3 domain-containing protein n=1 Tax=Tilletia indica TaxID=43049 RepID=A0A177TIB1_9BASI|nr:hypothetical protein A4X13_0g2517 [Tilletia indica]
MARTKVVARHSTVVAADHARAEQTSLSRMKVEISTFKGYTGAPDERPPWEAKDGTAALREMWRLMHTVELILPKAALQRLVKEIFLYYRPDFRIESRALAAIQEAMEAYLVNIFEDAQAAARHAGRITVFRSDIQLARRLRGDMPLRSDYRYCA